MQLRRLFASFVQQNPLRWRRCGQQFSTETEGDVIRRYVIGPLRQIEYICSQISDVDYVSKSADYFGASIGSHMRHILDHYKRISDIILLQPLPRLAQYDLRARNTVIEQDRKAALELSANIRNIIEIADKNYFDRAQSNCPNITVEFVNEVGQRFQLQSSVVRELSFTAHHGIHHLSTVRLMMKSLKYDIDFQEIGMAPSTILYNNEHGK